MIVEHIDISSPVGLLKLFDCNSTGEKECGLNPSVLVWILDLPPERNSSQNIFIPSNSVDVFMYILIYSSYQRKVQVFLCVTMV
jgi:hypothetical protein